jgi:hypothetical protein
MGQAPRAGRGESGNRADHRVLSGTLAKFSQNAAVCIATLFLLCLVTEVALRFFYHPENLGTVVRFDENLGWSLEPNSYLRSVDTELGLDYRIRVNSMGMREREFSRAKKPGTRRILVIGDSIAFGTGVDAGLRFSNFIDRALGDNTEVLNAGVCGWGTDQELIYYESTGRHLDPDAVVLTLTMANDVVNNMLDHLFLGSATKPRFTFDRHRGSIDLAGATLTPPSPPVRHRIRNLLRHSRLLVFVKRRIEATERAHAVANAGSGRPTGFEKEGLERNYSHWSVYENSYDDEFEQGWELTEALIGRFADLCRQDGVELIVFAFPLKIEVDEPWRRGLVEHHEIDPARFDFFKPYRRLASFCERRGIEFIYPLDDFKRASKKRSLYFTKDSHPNRYGNALAAQVLLETLHDRHDFAFSIAKPDLPYFTTAH